MYFKHVYHYITRVTQIFFLFQKSFCGYNFKHMEYCELTKGDGINSGVKKHLFVNHKSNNSKTKGFMFWRNGN